MKAEVFPGIEVDDRICFGRPRIKGTRITAEIIADRVLGEESLYSICLDYDIKWEQMLAAIRWCLLSRDRRARLLRKARCK